MSERKNPTALGNRPTRRQVIGGVAIAFGSLAAGSGVWAKTQQKMTETQSTGAEGCSPISTKRSILRRDLSAFMMRSWIPSSSVASRVSLRKSIAKWEAPFPSSGARLLDET